MSTVGMSPTSMSSAAVSKPENWQSTELMAVLTPFAIDS